MKSFKEYIPNSRWIPEAELHELIRKRKNQIADEREWIIRKVHEKNKSGSLNELIDKINSCSDISDSLVIHPARKKFLIGMCERGGMYGDEVYHSRSIYELSRLLGIKHENLSRAISYFMDKGLIFRQSDRNDYFLVVSLKPEIYELTIEELTKYLCYYKNIYYPGPKKEERIKKIVDLRESKKTFNAISAEIGVSTQRVRQIFHREMRRRLKVQQEIKDSLESAVNLIELVPPDWKPAV